MLKWLQHHGNLQWIPPQKSVWSTFFSRKKKIPSDIPKWSFSDLKTEPETPFGNRKFFFLKISVIPIAFWGEIYRELSCRWNHYIIISWSRSKVGKTMSKWWNNCNMTVISSKFHPKKHYSQLFFAQKEKKIPSDHRQMSKKSNFSSFFRLLTVIPK